MRYRELVHEVWQNVLLFILGAATGSFLNVVILRSQEMRRRFSMPGLPGGASAKTGRSRCPACGQRLSALELVPIFSWLLQAGRCRQCRAPISPQYPLVELAGGLLAVALLAPLIPAGAGHPNYVVVGEGLRALPPRAAAEGRPYINQLALLVSWPAALAVLDFIIAALLLVLFVVDLKTFLLPDKFLWPLAAVTAVHTVVRVTSYPAFGRDPAIGGGELPVAAPLGGAALGAGFLLLLWLATRGRGIGFGDVKLMIPLGLRFGVLGTITLLFIAFMAGGAYGAALLASRRATMKTAIPFGPFLIGTALLLMLIPDLPQRLLALLGWPL